MTTEQNSTERLREEILADARKKADELILSGKKEADAILVAAGNEAARIRQEIIDSALKEADRKSELILATVPVEIGKFKAERIESILESIYEEANKKIQDIGSMNYTEVLINLAADAINKMAGDFFNLKISWSDINFDGNFLINEISRRINRPVTITISEETDIMGVGIVVEDHEGRQIWDNRLSERLKRLWPAMRRKIALDAGFAM
ncbi:MAG TPA: V-type ATP synthase subunit E [Syntrophorhabdaceae bacterium]|nr:V-type ATP synthase subunit E [Syntrophorhabdaceae bacterium]